MIYKLERGLDKDLVKIIKKRENSREISKIYD